MHSRGHPDNSAGIYYNPAAHLPVALGQLICLTHLSASSLQVRGGGVGQRMRCSQNHAGVRKATLVGNPRPPANCGRRKEPANPALAANPMLPLLPGTSPGSGKGRSGQRRTGSSLCHQGARVVVGPVHSAAWSSCQLVQGARWTGRMTPSKPWWHKRHQGASPAPLQWRAGLLGFLGLWWVASRPAETTRPTAMTAASSQGPATPSPRLLLLRLDMQPRRGLRACGAGGPSLSRRHVRSQPQQPSQALISAERARRAVGGRLS